MFEFNQPGLQLFAEDGGSAAETAPAPAAPIAPTPETPPAGPASTTAPASPTAPAGSTAPEAPAASAGATEAPERFRRHFQSLQQQGEAMKAAFPDFDLMAELKNPAFVRMTAPGVGIRVEDAYYAIHRSELQAAAMQVTAQQAARKLANAIQSGRSRPSEAGGAGTAASLSGFDYRSASREQREALKKRIRAAAAAGEKVYPGNF